MDENYYNKALAESIRIEIRKYEDGEHPTIDDAWNLAIAMLSVVVADNEFSIHTLSHGRWQANLGIWHSTAKDYYRNDRISNSPQEAIWTAVRDSLSAISSGMQPARYGAGFGLPT